MYRGHRLQRDRERQAQRHTNESQEPSYIVERIWHTPAPQQSTYFALNTHARGIICVFVSLVNPRRMREGYGSRSVCLSVTTLTATYLVFKSQVKCHRVLRDVFNRCIVWILLKTLRSEVLA